MHYANGKEAKAGDLVFSNQNYDATNGCQIVGVLMSARPHDTNCNGTLQVVARRVKSEAGWSPWIPCNTTPNDWSVTLSGCNPIDPAVLFAPAQPASNS